MRDWDAERVARAAGAQLLRAPARRPSRGRAAGGRASTPARSSPGELFVGLPRRARRRRRASPPQALDAGAWGVLVAPAAAPPRPRTPAGAAVLVHEDPLAALQALARAWRRELGARGARVVAITGSTGKTSTKDILAALLGASAANSGDSPRT